MLASILLLTSQTTYDPWHDTALQTVLLAISTIIAAVIPKLMERRERKEISYKTTLDVPVSIMDNADNDDIYLVAIVISNTGNVSINSQDYVKPLEIDLKGRKTISTSPPAITNQTGNILDQNERKNVCIIYPDIEQRDRIKLKTFLIQKREAFTVSTMVTGRRGREDIEVTARIPEAKIIPANKGINQKLKIVIPFVLGIITMIWTLRLVSSWLPLDVQSIVLIILLIYTFLLALGLLIAFMLRIIILK